MNLIEFYENVIHSLGLAVTNDEYILTGEEDDDKALTINGVPLVIPTKEHIGTMMGMENGKPELVKMPFNPLKEDAIKGESGSIQSMKVVIPSIVGFKVALLGEYLLKLAEDTKLQKGVGMELVKFLASLEEANNANVKTIVDSKTITSWTKMYTNSLEANGTDFIELATKRRGVIGADTFTKTTTITAPILTALDSLDGQSINGTKLRNKDITVYKLLLRFILNMLNSDNYYSTGSNNNVSPTFISLYGVYLTTTNRFDKLFKSVKFIDPMVVGNNIVNSKIKIKDLDDLDMFRRELALIPVETEMLVNKKFEAMSNRTTLSRPTIASNMDFTGLNGNSNSTTNTITEGPVTAASILEGLKNNARPMGGMGMRNTSSTYGVQPPQMVNQNLGVRTPHNSYMPVPRPAVRTPIHMQHGMVPGVHVNTSAYGGRVQPQRTTFRDFGASLN